MSPLHRYPLLLLLLLGAAVPAQAAGPVRAPARRAFDLVPGPGRQDEVLIVKLAEDSGLSWVDGALAGAAPGDPLAQALAGAAPLLSRTPAAIRDDRRAFDPEHRLADLTLYLRLETPDAARLGARLLDDPRVETAYLGFAPVRPPADEDLPPTTPDLSALQVYRGAAPDGLGFDEAARWPGGDGANVAIADVEYGWDPAHEDLAAVAPLVAWGWDSGDYAYHGTAVLGELAAGDNGFGVTGMVPGAEVFVVSPYSDVGRYAVADAIDAAAALLDAGDVLLIEQQAYSGGLFVPVEVDPAVFDVIAAAVARGIVVVEPAANGAQDLDDPRWGGWFDRSQRDSGAIVVGGGVAPTSAAGEERARTWSGGSSYGTRVDLQGWYGNIVTTAGPSMADLFDGDGDARQGYTSSFGGTSGASPMVAAAAAAANSIAWELWGQPWDPWDLREALRSTGTPQPAADPFHIGPQPDLRAFLWTWGVR